MFPTRGGYEPGRIVVHEHIEIGAASQSQCCQDRYGNDADHDFLHRCGLVEVGRKQQT